MNVDFHLLVPQNDDELYGHWQASVQQELPDDLKRHFCFIRTRLNDLPGTRFDAIVSPANSYGRLGESSLQ